MNKEYGRSYRWPVGGCENENNKNLRNLLISKGIKKSLTTKERLHKKFEKTTTTKGKKEKYISYRNKFNHIVRIGRRITIEKTGTSWN